MRIKFTTSLASDKVSFTQGDVVDLPTADAKRYVAVGFAVPVKAAAKVETATLPEAPLEHATAVVSPDVDQDPTDPKVKA